MNVDAIKRQEAEKLIEAEVKKEIIQGKVTSSIFMQLATKLPNMTSHQTRLRVLDMLPMAYWVDGDTGMKQSTKMAWDNVFIDAGELAVIVPIPEAVLADADIDIMGQVTPRVKEAFGKAVDEAILFGINAPRVWGLSIVDRARQAGNNVAYPADANLYDLLLGENGVFAKVEESGYAVNNALAALRMKSKIRGVKDTTGRPLFNTNPTAGMPASLDGVALQFPENGSFDLQTAQLLAGDFKQAVYSIRQDITVKILDQAVIQDPKTGEIAYNLAQQDMIALRFVFRMGWALPNPVTALDPNRTSCPFAYLEPVTPVTTQEVTFTVKDNSTGAVPIDSAIVSVNGARKLTDSEGAVTFTLRDGDYKYMVKAEGHKTVQGTFTVASAKLPIDVTLNVIENDNVQENIRKTVASKKSAEKTTETDSE